MTETSGDRPRQITIDELRTAAAAGDPAAIVEMGRFYRAGVAGPDDLAEAEARALAFYRPGEPESLYALFALRREACAIPPPPPNLDELKAELNRRQAIGREPDPPELDEAGLAALREKADTGDPEASYQLGRVLLRKKPGDGPEALDRLLRAAEAGHATAAFHAGTLLHHGSGAPQDVPRALGLLESSARAGNADAACFLALALDGHMGVPPRAPEEAMAWWNEAARLGDPHACYVIGRLTIDAWTTAEERDRGRELMNHAAERGFPAACGFAGIVEALEHRFHPERLDGPALPLLRLGAVRGDDEAARCLAESLRTLGGKERYAEAVYGLRKASLRDAASSRVLSRHYFSGDGVPKSHETGAAWLALASDEGDGVPRDGARAVAWFERGVELRDRESEFCLANLLFDGRGVDADPARAFALLQRASGIVRDHVDHLLSVMLVRGEGVSPDPAQARTELLRAADGCHLPSLFTTLDEEALRYRPAALRPRDLGRRARRPPPRERRRSGRRPGLRQARLSPRGPRRAARPPPGRAHPHPRALRGGGRVRGRGDLRVLTRSRRRGPGPRQARTRRRGG